MHCKPKKSIIICSILLFFNKIIVQKQSIKPHSTTIPQYERIQSITETSIITSNNLKNTAAYFFDLATKINTDPEIAGPSKPPKATKAFAVGIENMRFVTEV